MEQGNVENGMKFWIPSLNKKIIKIKWNDSLHHLMENLSMYNIMKNGMESSSNERKRKSQLLCYILECIIDVYWGYYLP